MDSTLRDANVAAAAGPQKLTLGTGDNQKTWIVHPPALREFLGVRTEARRLCILAQSDPLEIVNRKIKEAEDRKRPLSQTMVDSMIAFAMKSAGNTETGGKSEPSEEQINATIANSPKIVEWWAVQLIRQVDKETTEETILELVNSDIVEMSFRIAEICKFGLDALSPNR